MRALLLVSLLSCVAGWVTPAVRKPSPSFLAPTAAKPLGARAFPQQQQQQSAWASSRCPLQQQPPQPRVLTVRAAQEGGEGQESGSKLPMLLDVETRGGILFVSTLGTLGVFGIYKLVVAAGVDSLQAGIYISVGMTLAMVAWTLTYIFRVANKDMTYAKQLKNYEDAVLAKRLEELAEDEVQALLEEVEKEGGKPAASATASSSSTPTNAP